MLYFVSVPSSRYRCRHGDQRRFRKYQICKRPSYQGRMVLDAISRIRMEFTEYFVVMFRLWAYVVRVPTRWHLILYIVHILIPKRKVQNSLECNVRCTYISGSRARSMSTLISSRRMVRGGRSVPKSPKPFPCFHRALMSICLFVCSYYSYIFAHTSLLLQ